MWEKITAAACHPAPAIVSTGSRWGRAGGNGNTKETGTLLDFQVMNQVGCTGTMHIHRCEERRDYHHKRI